MAPGPGTPGRDGEPGGSPGVDAQLEVFAGFPSVAEAMGVTGLDDYRAVCTGEAGDRRVVAYFSHRDFDGVRFGYRCLPPGVDRYEEVWLAEELATGALHRAMRAGATAEVRTGIIWLHLTGQCLGAGGPASPAG